MIAYTMLGMHDKGRVFAFDDALFEGSRIKRLFQIPSSGRLYGICFRDFAQNKNCGLKINFATTAVRKQGETS